MSEKIITIENRQGPYQVVFDRIMRMVPDRERKDKKLQRLLAFRLQRDGESATIEFLLRKIREMLRCTYSGSLYDFLKDDVRERQCRAENSPSPPVDIA